MSTVESAGSNKVLRIGGPSVPQPACLRHFLADCEKKDCKCLALLAFTYLGCFISCIVQPLQDCHDPYLLSNVCYLTTIITLFKLYASVVLSFVAAI